MKSQQPNRNRLEAVALSYDVETNHAPRIIGKGKGFLAENIIKKAHENNIPIQEDSTLLELLSQININETIPEELYKAVAEVFAFVYKIDQINKQ